MRICLSCLQVAVCLRDKGGRELHGILNHPSLTITAMFTRAILHDFVDL